MVAKKNIINKVQIGVNTPSLSNGLRLKDELGAFLQETVFPEMDEYFTSLQKNPSEIVRFEKILLEISIQETDSLTELKSLIIKRLKGIINIQNISENILDNFQVTNLPQSKADAFLYFIKNGNLPWWFEDKALFTDTSIMDELRIQNHFSQKLKLLLKQKNIRQRLVNQFNDQQLFQLVSASLKNPATQFFHHPIFLHYRKHFWSALLHYIAFKDEKRFVKIIQHELEVAQVKKLLKISNELLGLKIEPNPQRLKKEKKETKRIEDRDTAIVDTKREATLVKNAGLIVLHPFLKMFFEKMDFLSGKNMKSDKMDEAIHVMHYLATGREQPYEHELVFEKFLCNLPLGQSVNRHIFITDKQKIACELLLRAVLEHWTALKSNSVEMLQNEFLQREGKLAISENKQNLLIQRKAQDILLDKIPWNLHLIKIPWKEKILFVEW